MIINGTIVAGYIQQQVTRAVSHLKHRPPGLAFLLVGDNPASHAYVRMKKKRCAEVGILSIDREYSSNITERELIKEIQQLNNDETVDGILVQLPLPYHLSTPTILSAVDPSKDVDGFHPLNIGKLLIGERDGFLPCTPYGIHVLLTQLKIPVAGKHVVIVGRSNIVGKPMAAILMQKESNCNATVTVAHSLTANLAEICRSADILIVAIGKPQFVKKDMVKQGAVVIDVGMNRLEDGRLVGDVDFEAVAPLCSHITPVPGGVGPMTIAMLLSNTLLSYQRRVTII